LKSEYSGCKRYGVVRSKRNLLKLIFFTILILLSIETCRIFIGMWVAKPIVAQWGVIEKGCWVEALFLREETLITSDFEGNLKQKIENGARAPRGSVVAYISADFGLTAEPDADLLKLERRLFTLLSEDEALELELKRVNKEIVDRNELLKKSSLESSTVKDVKEDLGSLEQEKEEILRNIKSVREQILKTKVSIKGEMRGFKSIITPDTGYIFFQYDNWEGKLTPSHFSELSEEVFKNNFSLKPVSNRVKVGAIIGKTINPFNQTIAVKADTKVIGSPTKGDPWWLKNGDSLHRVTVRNIISLAGQKVILAFDDPGISQQYLPNRRGKIFAIYNKVNGVTIPSQALIKKEDRTFVKLPKGDGYSLQEVQVLETDGDKVVIEGIDFGTTIMSR
jgi:hypothetical protein